MSDNTRISRKKIRCAIYTRKSSEEGLDQAFNSLDAQREACEAYIKSQQHEGWVALPERYDDGGISGGTLKRPALEQLLQDIGDNKIDQIVVYKIDRLTRSLADFAKLVDHLDNAKASFVSVTQSFNTATSMGRLTLNVLLSFAQFEREVTAERIRDKITASKKKGLWMGGTVPLGYRPDERSLKIIEEDAKTIRTLFELYEEHRSLKCVKKYADKMALTTRPKNWNGEDANSANLKSFELSHLHYILTNPIYAGQIRHKEKIYEGKHEAIIEPEEWNRIQKLLTSKAPHERGNSKRITDKPLLLGKLFDETDDRLVPHHANKKGLRYRYYVSNRLVHRTGLIADEERNTAWRLPAEKLEQQLATSITTYLSNLNPAILLATVTIKATEQAANPITSQELAQVSNALKGISAIKETNRIFDLLSKVTIRQGSIEIELFLSKIASHLVINESRINQDVLSFTLPFQNKKRGVEMKFILGHDQPVQLDRTLISNLIKANHYYKELKSGKSYIEIASLYSTSKQRVIKLTELAFLSPKIVEAIFTGKQPSALTTDYLLRNQVPTNWDDQNKQFRKLA